MFAASIKQYVLDNPKLVTMTESDLYPGLFVLKYKKCVFYNNLWDKYLEECRGTIVDKDCNIISRPFQKIYNLDIEDSAPKLSDDTPVTAYRKANGFMVCITWCKEINDILVSTTGSTNSPYVNMAKETMLLHDSWQGWSTTLQYREDHSFLFECVHGSDPHIIPESVGLYFLGYRTKTWDDVLEGYGSLKQDEWKYLATGVFNCAPVESIQTTVGQLRVLSKSADHEGFVAYTRDNQAFKIKSPYYLINKFVARNPNTNKLMRSGIKQTIDEEYFPLIDAIQADIVNFTAKSEQDRLAWVRAFLNGSSLETFEQQVAAKRKLIADHTLELAALLRTCPHTLVQPKQNYYEGGYLNTAYTEYWTECEVCSKRSEITTKDHGHYS